MIAAVGIGRRYRQEHIVDLATKRLEFWDAYSKAALANAGSDPAAKEAVDKEVYEAIQQARRDTDAQLLQLSWRQLLMQDQLKPKPITKWQKFCWGSLTGFGVVFMTSFLTSFFWYIFAQHSKTPGLPSPNQMTFICIFLFISAAFLLAKATNVRYKPQKPIIQRV